MAITTDSAEDCCGIAIVIVAIIIADSRRDFTKRTQTAMTNETKHEKRYYFAVEICTSLWSKQNRSQRNAENMPAKKKF
jgi:hypothetical protein